MLRQDINQLTQEDAVEQLVEGKFRRLRQEVRKLYFYVGVEHRLLRNLRQKIGSQINILNEIRGLLGAPQPPQQAPQPQPAPPPALEPAEIEDLKVKYTNAAGNEITLTKEQAAEPANAIPLGTEFMIFTRLARGTIGRFTVGCYRDRVIVKDVNGTQKFKEIEKTNDDPNPSIEWTSAEFDRILSEGEHQIILYAVPSATPNDRRLGDLRDITIHVGARGVPAAAPEIKVELSYIQTEDRSNIKARVVDIANKYRLYMLNLYTKGTNTKKWSINKIDTEPNAEKMFSVNLNRIFPGTYHCKAIARPIVSNKIVKEIYRSETIAFTVNTKVGIVYPPKDPKPIFSVGGKVNNLKAEAFGEEDIVNIVNIERGYKFVWYIEQTGKGSHVIHTGRECKVSDDIVQSFFDRGDAKLRVVVYENALNIGEDSIDIWIEKGGAIVKAEKARYVGAPSKEKIEGFDFEVGVAETQGQREEMEDSHYYKKNFADREGWLFAGVYDGHGQEKGQGELAADLAKDLHIWFKNFLSKTKNVKEAFIQTYEYISQVIKTYYLGGVTAANTFIAGTTLFTAHAGDARVIVCVDDKAVFSTKDHIASDPSERDRIIKEGGTVTLDDYGIPRLNGMLIPSRTLGDRNAGPGLSSIPDVSAFSLTKLLQLGNTVRIVICCDGVFELGIMDVQEVAALANYFDKPENVAEAIKNEALKRGTQDNVTVMVVKLIPRAERKVKAVPLERTEESLPTVIGPEILPEQSLGITPFPPEAYQEAQAEARKELTEFDEWLIREEVKADRARRMGRISDYKKEFLRILEGIKKESGNIKKRIKKSDTAKQNQKQVNELIIALNENIKNASKTYRFEYLNAAKDNIHDLVSLTSDAGIPAAYRQGKTKVPYSRAKENAMPRRGEIETEAFEPFAEETAEERKGWEEYKIRQSEEKQPFNAIKGLENIKLAAKPNLPPPRPTHEHAAEEMAAMVNKFRAAARTPEQKREINRLLNI